MIVKVIATLLFVWFVVEVVIWYSYWKPGKPDDSAVTMTDAQKLSDYLRERRMFDEEQDRD